MVLHETWSQNMLTENVEWNYYKSELGRQEPKAEN